MKADRNEQQELGQQRRPRVHPTAEGLDPKTGDTSAAAQNIDLNHATFDQLLEIEGLDAELARSIIDYRKREGHFLGWRDLLRVPGVTEEIVACVQHAARLAGPDGAREQSDAPNRP